MTNQVIPAEAVEAAAKAEWARYGSAHPHATWETDSEEYKEHLRFGVTQTLEAAAPYIMRAAWDEGWEARGDWGGSTPNPYAKALH